MEVPHTAPTADLLGEPIPEVQAAAQNAALDRVLEHLAATGVHAQLIKRLSVQCETKPVPFAEKLWHPPQLVIYADAGWRVATVSIGRLSGSYMVELARVGAENESRADRVEVVPVNMPSRVGLLVAENAGVSV
ncbi:hypothetical protein [Nonomuraea sp. B19D2]|uniref:hypothetical protein n=1 Tax=Nonomuraea sp. B19D2 TaxID=3159561 RepID=UPI0032DAC8C8